MTTRFWVKLYIEILDDPKMGRLPNHLWRRAVELFLLAGREGNDGALPPVEEMAWTLRLSEDMVLEDLHGLAEVGVVHACASTAGTGEAEPGKWMVTNFSKRQAAIPVEERVRLHRERNDGVTKRYRKRNEVVADDSTSTSPSVSVEEERVQGEGEPLAVPRSPVDAMLHPDVRVFSAVTGRIPGLSQYRAVIEAVRFLRAREKLDDAALADRLKPYWLAWSSRKRLDGRPYDPGNITWLTEWALNGSIPPLGVPKGTEPVRSSVPSLEDTRRMLDEKDEKLKAAVPPPELVLAKIRGEFDVIHACIAKIEAREMVPVPGHPEAEPVPYDLLLQMENNGVDVYPVLSGGKMIVVNVSEMLNGVESEQMRKSREHGGNVINFNIGGNVDGSTIIAGDENEVHQNSNAHDRKKRGKS